MARLTVTRCPPAEREAALRLLGAAGDAAHRGALAAAIQAADAGDEASWDGLFVAGSPNAAAAVWVQPTPGNAAVVWPPDSSRAEADDLLRAACEFVAERQIPLGQMLTPVDDLHLSSQLVRCGFIKLAQLLYLCADLPSRVALPSQFSPTLDFQGNAGRDRDRLAVIIERTYIATQDCPGLDGLRSIGDVLTGYAAQGRHRPEHWYLVRQGDSDVGALILADHPTTGNWELVYMGLAPEARGRRLGRAVVEFAQDVAVRSGAQRLVAAVDAANAPALEMYRRTGFVEWDRRAAFACLGRAPAAQSLR